MRRHAVAHRQEGESAFAFSRKQLPHRGGFRASGEKDWTTVGRLPFKFAAGTKIGVNAHHGPADAQRWATLKDFRVLRGK